MFGMRKKTARLVLKSAPQREAQKGYCAYSFKGAGMLTPCSSR